MLRKTSNFKDTKCVEDGIFHRGIIIFPEIIVADSEEIRIQIIVAMDLPVDMIAKVMGAVIIAELVVLLITIPRPVLADALVFKLVQAVIRTIVARPMARYVFCSKLYYLDFNKL